MANGFKIADAYVEVHLDDDAISRETKTITNTVSRDLDKGMDKTGDESGSILAQGIRSGFIRKSPIIVAAIAGALTAGAPLITAAASTAMMGVAAAAVSQNEEVQSAWKGLWADIKSDAAADTAGLVPVFVNVAERVGGAFERIRPQLRDIFSALEPQIITVTDGLTGLIENTMPGLTRMIQGAGPVMQGFAGFLEKIGTGLSDMFDAMNEHSGASGEVFEILGDILADLLPLLGNLMGVGAELATVILPPLAAVVHAVATAFEFLAPILPVVAAGLLGLRVANGIAPMLASISANLATSAANGGTFSRMAGTASGTIGGWAGAIKGAGNAIPILGAVLAVIGTRMSDVEQRAKDWAQAMLEGGAAARAAAEDMDGGWKDAADGWVGSIPIIGQVWDFFTTTSEEASEDTQEAMDKIRESMSDVELASMDLRKAENDLALILSDSNSTAAEVAEGRKKVAEAAQHAAEEERKLEEATKGASIAMEDAQTKADRLKDALDRLNGEQMSLAESEIAFEASLDSATAALEENGRTLDITTEAGRNNKQALLDIASAAGDSADAYFDATGDYGGFVDRMNTGRQAIIDNAIAMGATQGEAQALADQVLRIPDEFDIKGTLDAAGIEDEMNSVLDKIDAAEEGATIELGLLDNGTVNRLSDMGIELETIDGKTWRVTVDGNDKQAAGAIGRTLEGAGLINGTEVKVVPIYGDGIAEGAQLDMGILYQLNAIDPTVMAEYNMNGRVKITEDRAAILRMMGIDPKILAQYDSEVPTGTATDQGLLGGLIQPNAYVVKPGYMGNSIQTGVGINTASLTTLAGQRPTPVAGLNSGPFAASYATAMGQTGTLNGQRPTPFAYMNTSGLAGSYGGAMGQVGTLAGQRPTPFAFMNIGGLLGGVSSALGSVFNLGGQRPTPNAGISIGGLLGGVGQALGSVFGLANQRPTPIATVSNQTGPGIASVRGSINSLPAEKTVTLTTITKNIIQTIRQFFGSGGGEVQVPGFDTGGHVRGAGTGTSDSIDARLSNGEFIMRTAAVQKYGVGFMNAINSGAMAANTATSTSKQLTRVISRSSGSFGGQSSPSVVSGPSVHIGSINVSIPAADLAEMRDVQDFFNRIGQEARRTNLQGVR